ncbi:toll/interleukin-1 receptor domain-containing protein [Actinosynnema sp. NPDC050436]|uniref:toll/interleukin-1 receptor domain-containing protein n=1 Tax=Actinosynnema sp. NPDC050436 TaxID=3155659 RepID=UPI0033DF4CEA
MRDECEASVALTLVDDGGKRLALESEDVEVGVLRLNRWQIYRVELEPGLFDGSSAYLVRINYELELDPGLPSMRWFEMGLDFQDDVVTTVLDAVPHGSRDPGAESSYALNRYLQLVPGESSSNTLAHLPAVEEMVDVYGIGKSSVRWRCSTDNSSGVRPGSRVAWIVLLVPEGHVKQRCRLAARYDLRVDEDGAYWPTQRSTAFTVTLDDPRRDAVVRPSATASLTEPLTTAPSVFICYAHESPQFKADVKALANLLLKEGIDVRLDQFEEGPRKNWDHWALGNFKKCDFILLIASPACRKVGDGDVEGGQNLGLRSELNTLATFYQRHPEWAKYVLPVILPGQSKYDIPIFLGPEREDYYDVDDYSTRGIERLMAAIRETPLRDWDLR